MQWNWFKNKTRVRQSQDKEVPYASKKKEEGRFVMTSAERVNGAKEREGGNDRKDLWLLVYKERNGLVQLP